MQINNKSDLIALVESKGSIRKAAKAIDIPYSTFHGRYIKQLELAYGANSVTLRLDKESNEMRPYYLKTNTIKTQLQAASEAILNFDYSRIEPLSKTKRPYKPDGKDAVLVITDLHINDRCSKSENGQLDGDWDLTIAKNRTLEHVSNLINENHSYNSITVSFIGDYFHFDSAVRAETPASGHNLNSSASFEDMIDCGIELARDVIDHALKFANIVKVVVIAGNHDEACSLWLSKILPIMFSKDERVIFETTHQWTVGMVIGGSAVLLSHGDKIKFKDAPIKLTNKYKHLVGITTNTYCISGHFHHQEIKEDNGVTNIMCRSLCPNDSFSAKGHYSSERALTLFVFNSYKLKAIIYS